MREWGKDECSPHKISSGVKSAVSERNPCHKQKHDFAHQQAKSQYHASSAKARQSVDKDIWKRHTQISCVCLV